mgnify:CR=1 FL=1|tara:strand:- start:900 stop:1313 length:414 start_codon:yes stop_codon:yes gene_type:complete
MPDFDILDLDTTNIVEPRNPPPGRYLATYVNYDFTNNAKGTVFGAMNWRLESPLENQDMTGVNLGRLLEGKVILTENTVPYIKRDFRNAFAYEPAEKPKQWFEDNVGKQAVVVIGFDAWWKKTKGVEKPVVSSFFAA